MRWIIFKRFRLLSQLHCPCSLRPDLAHFQIEYECVDGFELVGKDTRYCQSDGTWTPSELPTCVPVQCPIPDSPGNGKAMYTAVAYKSVVSYECKYGFMIVGDATRYLNNYRKYL